MLLVDAANVVGSRPTGWWRDRPGAARSLIEQISQAAAASRLPVPVVVVLEGAARRGAPAASGGNVEVVHAPGSGDDTLVELTAAAVEGVCLVTADRALAEQARRLGAEVVGPRWLLGRL